MIFILLLLVFVHRTAGKDAAVTDVLLKRLLHDMKPQGFNEKTIPRCTCGWTDEILHPRC